MDRIGQDDFQRHIFDPCYGGAVKIARSKLGDSEDAKDLVIEKLSEIYIHAPTNLVNLVNAAKSGVPNAYKIRGYVFQSVARACIRRVQSNKPLATNELDQFPGRCSGPEESAKMAEIRKCLLSICRESLVTLERIILLRSILSPITDEKMAARYYLKVDNLRMIRYRARLKLKSCLPEA